MFVVLQKTYNDTSVYVLQQAHFQSSVYTTHWVSYTLTYGLGCLMRSCLAGLRGPSTSPLLQSAVGQQEHNSIPKGQNG